MRLLMCSLDFLVGDIFFEEVFNAVGWIHVFEIVFISKRLEFGNDPRVDEV